LHPGYSLFTIQRGNPTTVDLERITSAVAIIAKKHPRAREISKRAALDHSLRNIDGWIEFN
jgi:hypothetical protein